MLGVLLNQRYEVICKLGEGGFSETWLARDYFLPGKSLVVVKQLRIPQSPLLKIDPQDIKRRFDREAEILYDLGGHKRIPTLFAHFQENNDLFLIQEYIDGHDFQDELNDRIFAEIDVISFLKDILILLSFVHSKRIIHRDIKPQNIIRNRVNGKLHLIDFGAVKEVGLEMNMNATGSYSSATIKLGTKGYMSNEQANGKPRFSSDLYSLGIIGIQALTGLSVNQIEEDEDTGSLVWQHHAKAGSELRDFLNKMTHSYHAKRFKSANEALQAISTLKPANSCFIFPSSYYFLSWYAKANFSKNQGNHRLAIELYNHAIKMDATKANAWFNKGICYQYLNNIDEAITSFCQALRLNINYFKAWLHLGKMLDKKEEHRGAIFVFRQAVSIDVNQIHAWTCLTLSLHKAARYQESIQIGDKVLEIKNDDINFKILMIENFRRLLQFNEALALCEDMKESHPKTYKILLKKGLILRDMQRYEEALEVLKQASEFQRDFQVCLEIANISLKIERPKEAQEFYSYALQINPSSVEAKLNLGLAFEALGDLKKAQKTFYDAVALSEGKNLLAFIHFGRICEEIEDFEYAAKSYGSLINLLKLNINSQSFKELISKKEFHDTFTTLINKQVALLTNLYRFEESIELCFDISMLLKNAHAWINCGVALFERGDFQDSIRAYKLALEIDSENFDAWYNSGNSFLKIRDYEKAIECYKKALEIDPNSSQAYNNMSFSELSTGKYEQALLTIDRSLSCEPDKYKSLITKSLILRRLYRFSESADLCLKAVAIKSEEYYPWYLRAISLHELYDFRKAYEAYNRVLSLKEDFRTLNNKLMCI